jgi:hypothetical protein
MLKEKMHYWQEEYHYSIKKLEATLLGFEDEYSFIGSEIIDVWDEMAYRYLDQKNLEAVR